MFADAKVVDCGMTYLTEEGIREDAKERTPDAAAEVDATVYGCFDASEGEGIGWNGHSRLRLGHCHGDRY